MDPPENLDSSARGRGGMDQAFLHPAIMGRIKKLVGFSITQKGPHKGLVEGVGPTSLRLVNVPVPIDHVRLLHQIGNKRVQKVNGGLLDGGTLAASRTDDGMAGMHNINRPCIEIFDKAP